MARTPYGLHLLDHLARLAGCQYLSDLRFPAAGAGLRRALLDTPAADFPEEQWRQAARYILGGAWPGGAVFRRFSPGETTKSPPPQREISRLCL